VDERAVCRLVQAVTPEALRQWVEELEPRQPEPNRNTVPLYAILDRLAPELPGMEPAERVPVEMRLRRAVIEAAAHAEGLTFVETDG
jgi:hypothetical protein